MRSLVLPCLLVLLASVLTAQTAFTRLDEGDARDIAAARGTFVIIDFYANWCGPCKTMDDKVWSLDTIQSVQEAFVNIRVDASTSNAGLLRYGIKAIPALIIMDANGEEYFRKVGYLQPEEILELLDRFPADMRGAYAADIVAKQESDAFNSHFLRARHYQEAARSAKRSIAGKLAATSDAALKSAHKILAKNANNPASLLEYLALMEAENLVLRGRAKKALKALAAIGEEVNAKNEALACYIKGMAYRRSGKPELAQDCYEQLRGAPGNEVFLTMYEAEERR